MVAEGFSKGQLNLIEQDFLKLPLLNQKQVESVSLDCNQEELFCLKYLYAYMPISDLATYDVKFFLKMIKDTLHIMTKVPWGDKINGELFLNHVLPLRLNNEDLTDHRELFFQELFPRIEGMSLHDAILEVNYWCFEKATYRATDPRTVSPLTIISNAYGRCGEESVLGVSALRSVGIPARQCYTPRWSHCDSNHAWVEVWKEDGWHCLGACEPEPVLDKGWFVETVKRGMLVHARVFSRIVSEAEITLQTDKITQLNVSDNYFQTKRVEVFVLKEGKPLKQANVRFEVINYSELFPIVSLDTDENGRVEFLTGVGDVNIHISYEGAYICEKMEREQVLMKVDMKRAVTTQVGVVELDIVPPDSAGTNEPSVTEEMAKVHERKNGEALAKRKAFEATFMTGDKAVEFASKYESDQEEIVKLLGLANGNYPDIIKFLDEDNQIKDELHNKVLMLNAMNVKDVADTTFAILNHIFCHIMQYKGSVEEDIFVPYLLNPRVHIEMISDHCKCIDDYFSGTQKEAFRENPYLLQEWIIKEIEDCKNADYDTIFATPQGLLELKCGSLASRKVLFVCACRTLGIPARMRKSDQKLEFYQKGKWNTIQEQEKQEEVLLDCKLVLKQDDSADYEYHKQYTIAKLVKGIYRSLSLAEYKFDNGSVTYELEAGNYRMITANRLKTGKVLAVLDYFVINSGETIEKVLQLRKEIIDTSVAISVPPINARKINGESIEVNNLLKVQGNTVVALIQVAKEPTEHLLNEIMAQHEKFAQQKEKIVVLVKEESDINDKLLKKVVEHTGLQICIAGADEYSKMVNALGEDNDKYPLVMFLNENRDCVHKIFGYNVGTGELMLDHLV